MYLLIQPVDDHDWEVLDEQVTAIAKAVQVPFVFVAFLVKDWNQELSPWDSPAVFGGSDFGHGAAETLHFVETVLLPAVRLRYHSCYFRRILPGSFLFFMVCLADADFLGYCCSVAVGLVSPLAGLCQEAAATDTGDILELG